MATKSKNSKSEIMKRIALALDRVTKETHEKIIDLAEGLSETEIINLFNQAAMDFFDMAITKSKELGREREFGFTGYQFLFESALKINMSLPIDKFTLIILEFAPDIYDANEEYFLSMDIPDAEIKANNEFGIIRSKEFKKLWGQIDADCKEVTKDHITSLTVYAHAYFLKLLFNKKK